MSIHEIVLPETKPETEWVRGRARQKVSPTYSHGTLQGLLFTALRTWADDAAHGRVATEWRFRIAPPGAVVRPLVPDVAYLAYADCPRMRRASSSRCRSAHRPLRSRFSRPTTGVSDVEHKIVTYLAAGTSAVIVVDPHQETIAVHDGNGVRRLSAGDVLVIPCCPDSRST